MTHIHATAGGIGTDEEAAEAQVAQCDGGMLVLAGVSVLLERSM